MNLASLMDIFRTVLAKKGIKPNGHKNSSDFANDQMNCTGDICLCNWKPCQTKADYPDKSEQRRQNFR